MNEDLLNRFIENIPMFAMLLASLSIHEAAHAWMAKQCGDGYAESQGRLTVNPVPHIDPIGTILLPIIQMFTTIPLLCWAKPVPVNEGKLRRPGDVLWVALAGPVSNLLLAAWGLFMLKATWTIYYFVGASSTAGGLSQSPPFLEALTGYMFYFVLLNLFLAAFNMIPVPPLDGSRILYHSVIHRSRSRSVQDAWSNVERYGFTIFLLLIITGGFRKVAEPFWRWASEQVWILM